MNKDVLDRVYISSLMFEQWKTIIEETIEERGADLNGDEIEDEQAHVLNDGSLLLFCKKTNGETIASMTIASSHWSWMHTIH